MSYFSKILIANRGEIARRIIRTCRRLGIQTVAVYSEADQDMPYVREADESVCIGPAPASKSYLNIDRLIDAARVTGAEAVHPGYGFLSENPEFAFQCREHGLTFIGPSPDVIRAMGDKIEARRIMASHGIPVVPGYDEAVDTVETAVDIANEIGYPIMLKASAGGGGIGMHIVRSDEELKQHFPNAVRQAENFFGNGRVFIEKWIPDAHHVEVQIAADLYGEVRHLFERECSVQRRHQKVVEESPSPTLNDHTRQRLLDAAVRGAQAIGYQNLGTMEFICDNEGNFYFLEMNTRLQVEHPVTEQITGLDLVELQIRLARGEPMPVSQSDILVRGHAVECRVYAEDPVTYMPSPGRISRLDAPWTEARFDFGVEEGSTVTPFYDPMIGKIIVGGADRSDAVQRMADILQRVRLEGIRCNLPLLIEIMNHPDFRAGKYTTQFLQRLRPSAR